MRTCLNSILLLPVLVILSVLSGCQGDPGNSGVSMLPEDVWAPEVSLILPVASRSIYDQVAMEAYAEDDVGVDSVEFLVDGLTPQSDELIAKSFPWQIFWDCSQLNEGMHTIQARAWDSSGKYGLSPVSIVTKEDASQKPAESILKNYIEDDQDFLLWKLPDDFGEFNGYGARFVPDGPCRIYQFFVHVFWDSTWAGDRNFSYEVWSSHRNQPDSLLFADTTSIKRKRGVPGGYKYMLFMRGSDRVYSQGEFFILMTPADDVPGDTLSIVTDNGQWRNYLGFARKENEWDYFTIGTFQAFNPHIYAVVIY